MRECDLIMKGGITSGVVYPRAIIELASSYRLRSIGGTSAGAIAAVFAAAAEYRRQRGGGMAGFDEIENVASELGSNLEALIQPSPTLQPLYNLLVAAVSKKAREGRLIEALLWAVLDSFRGQVFISIGIFAAATVIAILIGSFWFGVLGFVLAVVTLVVLVVLALYRLVILELPKNDFGICPGLTLRRNGVPGFSDWIADKIDLIAGNVGEGGRLGDPLTVRQLEACGVSVAAMTTDLSSARPYHLPLREVIHLFSKREFEALLPPRVVSYLVTKGEPLDPNDERVDSNGKHPDDLHWLPSDADFPVLLIARISLSFPGLIRAVPLYRFDDQQQRGKTVPIRRCLFSDGGISSNFPIHFFDALLPRRPTFGIALSRWEEDRHQEERVDLPRGEYQNTSLPVREITSVPRFLSAILNTAKDWQDTMQSLLPGYAERIVTVRLDDRREGGMNLRMNAETIGQLIEYGRLAGDTLKTQFDFDQHRYYRAISLLPELEGALDRLAAAYRMPSAAADEPAYTYREVLTDFETRDFANPPEWRRETLAALADNLAAIGDVARQKHADGNSMRDGNIPPVDTQVRLAALADRVPPRADVGS